MKFVLIQMWKSSKLSLKLAQNEGVLLNFEEVIAKKSKFQYFLKF